MVAVWLASRSQQYPSASERYSYNRLRNRFVAAFRPSSQTSFRSLWRDTAGGSCVGDPVLPRSLPYFIQLFLLRLRKVCAQPVSTRRWFLFGASAGGR